MANLSKLILPVKNQSTGEVTDQEFNLPSGGGSVTVDSTGTASATDVRYQRIGVNDSYTEIVGTKYMEQSVTLSTSSETVVTFTNNDILVSSAIDLYTSDPKLSYNDMSISAGSCTITFDKQSSAATVSVRIYIK